MTAPAIPPETNTETNTIKDRRPTLLPLIIIGVTVLLFIGFAVALLNASVTPPDAGPAPNFALTTFDNQPFSLADQRGKVTVINFWASWCNTCPGEAPLLNALWNDYQNKGVSLIGVAHLDSSREASLAFMRQYNVRYPSAADDGNHASDAYHIKQVPETYVVDQHGQIVYVVHNALDSTTVQALRAKLDQLLTAPPKTS